MTDAELKGIAAQALNLAKLDRERGQFNFLLASYHEGEGLHRMTKIEATIIQMLGEEWMNSGARKDIGFGIIRLATAILPPDALVFVTAANGFAPTAKFHALPLDQQKALIDAGHDRHHEAAKEGFFELHDIWAVVAQTAERVCLYEQANEPDAKPHCRFCPQDEFGGRMKVYGADLQKTVRMLEHYREQSKRAT